MRMCPAAVMLAMTLCAARPAGAAVVDASPNGFAIQQIVHVAAPPDKAYAALIRPALWWNSEHTFSQNAANLSLDARAGGCFCEALPNGGSVQHSVVVDADPGNALRLRGALGPFQGQGADGALSFTLKATPGGTDIVLDNILGGYMKGGWGDWPKRADAMLAEQMARLKLYLETGAPQAKP